MALLALLPLPLLMTIVVMTIIGGDDTDCSNISRGFLSVFCPWVSLNCGRKGHLPPSPRSPCSCPSEGGGTTIACRRQELQSASLECWVEIT